MTATAAPSVQSAPPANRLLSPLVHRELDQLLITPGQHILDIAGTSDITTRLAALVGPTGSVTAVDQDTRHLHPTHVIDVYGQDPAIAPLPGSAAGFDGVVASWLSALPSWPDLLAEMIIRLRPGGWLILADITDTPLQVYRATGNEDDAKLILRVMRTIYAHTLGNGGRSANAVDTMLITSGMQQIRSCASIETWNGGGTGCALLADIATALHDGHSDGDLDRFVELMANPQVSVRSYALRATHARKAN
ncbi:hypothetical protein ABT235_20830 [Micromonospora echinofusca]|uniref:class I SAM-dependent methyltransferase n=1 Tax=Micromonospora echinofusca TaxID=47858 RepID=UPI000C7063DB